MLIVADDLTGAADSAGAFAMHGHRATVRLSHTQPSVGEIAAYDTNSRSMSAADAFFATAAAVGLRPDGGVFVKIDSTLRGHVLAAIEGALAAMPRRPARVAVCPAFPARGRTVVDAAVQVDGHSFAGAHVGDILREFSGTGLVIADAQSDDDLAALVDSMPADVLWVGSAGLARHVAQRIAPNGNAPLARIPARRVGVVAGSQHPTTLEQLNAITPGAAQVFRVDPGDATAMAAIMPLLAVCDALVLTGGHTARVVLDKLGIRDFVVGGEIDSGVPWAMVDRSGSPLTLVTKSGAFGDEQTLRGAVEFLLQP